MRVEMPRVLLHAGAHCVGSGGGCPTCCRAVFVHGPLCAERSRHVGQEDGGEAQGGREDRGTRCSTRCEAAVHARDNCPGNCPQAAKAAESNPGPDCSSESNKRGPSADCIARPQLSARQVSLVSPRGLQPRARPAVCVLPRVSCVCLIACLWVGRPRYVRASCSSIITQ